MKAVISSTYDSQYLFFIPIVAYCWSKLDVGTICFLPILKTETIDNARLSLISHVCGQQGVSPLWWQFNSPKDKEVTYTQCSRLYAACLDLPDDELVITSDVDMGVFRVPSPITRTGGICIWGSDLVSKGQYPICYLSGTVKEWRDTFDLHGKTYQQALDGLLGHIEASNFRGNYWCKDQDEAYIRISKVQNQKVTRTTGHNMFATLRVDRTDDYWRDRLNLDLMDAHFWRPGYEETNFKRIMEVLTYIYPQDDLTWLENYREEYIKLL